MKPTMTLDEARRMALATGASLEIGGKVFNAGRNRLPGPEPEDEPEPPVADVAEIQEEAAEAKTNEKPSVSAPIPVPEPIPAPVFASQTPPLQPALPQQPTSIPVPLVQRARERVPHTFDLEFERGEDNSIQEGVWSRDGTPRYRITPVVIDGRISKLSIVPIDYQ